MRTGIPLTTGFDVIQSRRLSSLFTPVQPFSFAVLKCPFLGIKLAPHIGAPPMPIIDSQVHAYEANTQKWPWHSVPNWPDHVTGDDMIAAMSRVGVEGAIFISAFSMYRYDASYAVEVQRAHPAGSPSSSRSTRTTRRWPISSPSGEGSGRGRCPNHAVEGGGAPDDPDLDHICRVAVRNDLPVNVLFWGNVRRRGVDRLPSRDAVHHRPFGDHASRACRPRLRSPGPTSRRCWNSQSARTRS